MSNWKLHTPNGVNDILPDECAVKKEIESTIWSVFSSIGYKEVETPTFEYYDCYLGLSGQISQEHMFKFFDEQGRILALRPDFTTSIARMAATKVANSDKATGQLQHAGRQKQGWNPLLPDAENRFP